MLKQSYAAILVTLSQKEILDKLLSLLKVCIK